MELNELNMVIDRLCESLLNLKDYLVRNEEISGVNVGDYLNSIWISCFDGTEELSEEDLKDYLTDRKIREIRETPACLLTPKLALAAYLSHPGDDTGRQSEHADKVSLLSSAGLDRPVCMTIVEEIKDNCSEEEEMFIFEVSRRFLDRRVRDNIFSLAGVVCYHEWTEDGPRELKGTDYALSYTPSMKEIKLRMHEFITDHQLY